MIVLKRKPSRIVIYYHGIKASEVGGFSRQMSYLAAHYKVVKPSEIISTVVDRRRLVAVTIDDAFTSAAQNAVPVLKEYGLSAGFFIPTGNLGATPLWEMPHCHQDRHETVVSQQQIVALYEKGFEILSHTVSHPKLTSLDDEMLEAELVGSKRMLEAITGQEVTSVSYPHGDCDKRVSVAAARAGYKLGFTTAPIGIRPLDDCMKLGRFSVSPVDGMIKFRLKVSGAYEAVRLLRTAKKIVKRIIGVYKKRLATE